MSKKPEEPVILAGWLVKRGQVKKNWKRRYCKLSGIKILYYVSDKSPQPKGFIDLSQAQIQHVRHDPKLFVGPKKNKPPKDGIARMIVIRVPGRNWYFYPESDREISRWVSAIHTQIHKRGKPVKKNTQKDLKPLTPAANSPSPNTAQGQNGPTPVTPQKATPNAVNDESDDDDNEGLVKPADEADENDTHQLPYPTTPATTTTKASPAPITPSTQITSNTTDASNHNNHTTAAHKTEENTAEKPVQLVGYDKRRKSISLSRLQCNQDSEDNSDDEDEDSQILFSTYRVNSENGDQEDLNEPIVFSRMFG